MSTRDDILAGYVFDEGWVTHRVLTHQDGDISAIVAMKINATIALEHLDDTTTTTPPTPQPITITMSIEEAARLGAALITAGWKAEQEADQEAES